MPEVEGNREKQFLSRLQQQKLTTCQTSDVDVVKSSEATRRRRCTIFSEGWKIVFLQIIHDQVCLWTDLPSKGKEILIWACQSKAILMTQVSCKQACC